MKYVYGVVAGVVVGLFFAILYFRNPLKQVKLEFDAIEAARAAKQEVLDKGAEAVRKQIEAEHAETIKAFNAEQEATLSKLRNDPVALARWLTRVSG